MVDGALPSALLSEEPVDPRRVFHDPVQRLGNARERMRQREDAIAVRSGGEARAEALLDIGSDDRAELVALRREHGIEGVGRLQLDDRRRERVRAEHGQIDPTVLARDMPPFARDQR